MSYVRGHTPVPPASPELTDLITAYNALSDAMGWSSRAEGQTGLEKALECGSGDGGDVETK